MKKFLITLLSLGLVLSVSLINSQDLIELNETEVLEIEAQMEAQDAAEVDGNLDDMENLGFMNQEEPQTYFTGSFLETQVGAAGNQQVSEFFRQDLRSNPFAVDYSNQVIITNPLYKQNELWFYSYDKVIEPPKRLICAGEVNAITLKWEAADAEVDQNLIIATNIQEIEEIASGQPQEAKVYYEVLRSNSANGNFVKINTAFIMDTTFTDKNLPANSTFYYKVRSIDENNKSDFTNIAYATTKPDANREMEVSFTRDVIVENNVNIFVNIINQTGNVIQGVQPENVSVQENGVGVRVIGVDQITEDKPLSITFTMDYSGSMSDEDIKMMETLVKGIVNTKKDVDEFNIIKFADEPYRQSGFTTDSEILISDIENTNYTGCTALYDSIYEALVDTKDRENRRVVVAFTDGMNNSSSKSFLEVIEYAQQLGIPIYTVFYNRYWDLEDVSYTIYNQPLYQLEYEQIDIQDPDIDNVVAEAINLDEIPLLEAHPQGLSLVNMHNCLLVDNINRDIDFLTPQVYNQNQSVQSSSLTSSGQPLVNTRIIVNPEIAAMDTCDPLSGYTMMKLIADYSGGTVEGCNISSTGLYEKISNQIKRAYIITFEVDDPTGKRLIELEVNIDDLNDSFANQVYYTVD